MVLDGGTHRDALVMMPTRRSSSSLTKHVPRDGTEPGPESSAVFHSVELAICTDENLLGRVLGIGQRPAWSTEAPATADRKHERGMPIMDPPEGFKIP